MEWMVLQKPRLREWVLMSKRRKRTVLKFASFVEMEFDEEKNTSPSHAECSVQPRLCRSNRCNIYASLRKTRWPEWKGGSEKKAKKRQQENLLMKTEIQQENQLLKSEMCARMDEGLKKKEENARQMVQNDFVTMKEKIRQIKLGSGSGGTVCSDASTAVEKDQVELSRDHRQALVIVLTISLCQERWDGSQTTNNVATKDSQTPRLRISSLTYNSWDLLTRARILLSSSPFKKPSPGMCPIWNCLDMCVLVTNLVSQRCWFQNSFAQSRDHGSLFEERCTAILFGTTMVMAVYAPDSSKSLQMYEACISSVM